MPACQHVRLRQQPLRTLPIILSIRVWVAEQLDARWLSSWTYRPALLQVKAAAVQGEAHQQHACCVIRVDACTAWKLHRCAL